MPPDTDASDQWWAATRGQTSEIVSALHQHWDDATTQLLRDPIQPRSLRYYETHGGLVVLVLERPPMDQREAREAAVGRAAEPEDPAEPADPEDDEEASGFSVEVADSEKYVIIGDRLRGALAGIQDEVSRKVRQVSASAVTFRPRQQFLVVVVRGSTAFAGRGQLEPGSQYVVDEKGRPWPPPPLVHRTSPTLEQLGEAILAGSLVLRQPVQVTRRPDGSSFFLPEEPAAGGG